MNRLHVERHGSGEPVVLVHGSVVGWRETWSRQLPLAQDWSLVLVDRPGYGANPQLDGRVDFEADGNLVAELLAELDGAHLVGHSYGGLVAAFGAAGAPSYTRSLTLVEPPAFALLADDPVVHEYVAAFRSLWRNAPDDPVLFLRRFFELVGAALPEPVPPELARGAVLLLHERHVWEADLPIGRIRDAAFPTLVVSGGHHDAFERLCDVLQAKLGAARATVPGAGHSIPRVGAPFTELLDSFLRTSSASYLATSAR
jgi:pimeloyl-ACP methyl ester carboxylesterase